MKVIEVGQVRMCAGKYKDFRKVKIEIMRGEMVNHKEGAESKP